MASPIQALAEFLTGVDVPHHSICLGMPEGSLSRAQAQRFFALRNAFGVGGYADADEARRAIIRTIGESLDITPTGTVGTSR